MASSLRPHCSPSTRAGIGDEIVLPERRSQRGSLVHPHLGSALPRGGCRGSLTALSADAPLSSLVNDSSIEPGRRAALDARRRSPSYTTRHQTRPRRATVVIEAPLARSSKTFRRRPVSVGLGHDAFSHLAPLTPSFNPTLDWHQRLAVDASHSTPSTTTRAWISRTTCHVALSV